MVECAIMIALASVLSIFKLVELPFGGSVTVASALPILIVAYRHGSAWGLASGLAFAVVQQLTGLKTLSYVTGWQSVLAVILLDYIIAFTVMGLGGAFRSVVKKQSSALMLGACLASVLRYSCHVIAGATVWKGLSIPDAAALIYSFGYNATYMLPETVVLVVAAGYLGSLLDFSRPELTRLERDEQEKRSFLYLVVAGAALLIATITDAALIAPFLQDDEGMFTLSRLGEVNIIAVSIVTAIAFVIAAAAVILKKRQRKEE